MPLRPRQRQAFLRLALLAMLMLACAPTVSRLLATTSGAGWGTICSAQRPNREQEPAPGHVFEHCPFCALHFDLALPPPPALPPPAPALALRERDEVIVRSPRSRWVWTDAQPRAPPAAVA